MKSDKNRELFSKILIVFLSMSVVLLNSPSVFPVNENGDNLTFNSNFNLSNEHGIGNQVVQNFDQPKALNSQMKLSEVQKSGQHLPELIKTKYKKLLQSEIGGMLKGYLSSVLKSPSTKLIKTVSSKKLNSKKQKRNLQQNLTYEQFKNKLTNQFENQTGSHISSSFGQRVIKMEPKYDEIIRKAQHEREKNLASVNSENKKEMKEILGKIVNALPGVLNQISETKKKLLVQQKILRLPKLSNQPAKLNENQKRIFRNRNDLPKLESYESHPMMNDGFGLFSTNYQTNKITYPKPGHLSKTVQRIVENESPLNFESKKRLAKKMSLRQTKGKLSYEQILQQKNDFFEELNNQKRTELINEIKNGYKRYDDII